jgi:hypothetical protein
MHSFPHPSALIGNAAIISAKIAANVIATPHIANQGILSASIGALQIGTPHIADQAILSAKIGANIIGTPHIQAGGILSAAIGALQIDAPHIAWGAITSGKILSGTQFAGIIGTDRFTKARIEITSGKLWKGAGPGANPTEIDVPSAGEGHIIIFGWNYQSIGQGEWTSGETLSQALATRWYNNGVNLDNISYNVYLAAGTYTLRLLCHTDIDHGILDIDLDGVEIASFDGYSAATTWNVLQTQTGIVVATAGIKTLKLRVDGKNASSTSYIVEFTTITLWRTA